MTDLPDGQYVREPAWLTAKIDQRIAMMKDVLGPAVEGFADYNVVMTPLTEPPEGASEVAVAMWDGSCDNCGRFCPTLLWTGKSEREVAGVRVVITFGACPQCSGLPA